MRSITQLVSDLSSSEGVFSFITSSKFYNNPLTLTVTVTRGYKQNKTKQTKQGFYI